MSRFVNETLALRSPAATLFNKIKEHGWTCFLCGGTVRDLLLKKGNCFPRDVDIIVHYVEKARLLDVLRGYHYKENKFGGLSIQIQDWKVDVWTLSSTWAFRNKIVKYNNQFSDYTKTTFLNIEAIAVEMFVKKGKKRAIYSNGFFESIENRLLEINLEKNPDPEVNVSRAILMSLQYGFSLGPHLRNYIISRLHQLNKDRLLTICKDKYLLGGSNRCWLDNIFEKIKQDTYSSEILKNNIQGRLFF